MPLRAELEHAGWRVVLRGRADGVRHTPEGGICIEECKSAWPDAAVAPAVREAAARQVAVYAWMWEREAGSAASAVLVWLPIGEGPPRREPVAVEGPALEARVRAAVDAWIALVECEAACARARREAAGAVRFPYVGMRPGQAALADAVERALREREHLLVEAPTGLGKTAAVLTPALRFALAEGKRVLFLTATGLGQRAALATLRALAPSASPGAPATGGTAVRLRARSALCANDVLLCHESACRFARDHEAGSAASGLPERLLDAHPVLEPDVLRAAAVDAGVCPFELALDAAGRAVVAVADYHYVFHPRVRSLAPDDDALADAILVVDEVHRLPDRARDALSVVLDGVLLHRAAERAALGGAPVHATQAALCRELLELLAETVAAAGPADAPADWEIPFEVPAERLEALARRFDLALLATLAYRRATRSLDPDDPFLDVAFALAHFVEAAGRAGDVTLVGARQGAPWACRRCLDPSAHLAPLLARCHAFVGVSATPPPPGLAAAELGLDPERAARARVPDPFPAGARRLVIDPTLDTRHRARGRTVGAVAARLAALAAAVPGHTLALLPSHAFLAVVRERLAGAGLPLRAQGPGDGEAERQALLDALETSAPHLVLAVAGGVFAESVDLPAGRVKAVAVVGPCLPPPTTERRLLAERYDEAFGDGFGLAYALPGMTRVIQAAGRLVRAETDRGVVALYGRRFLREPFRSALPEAWLGGAAPEERVGDPAQVAVDFFAAGADA